ncbi:MAG: metalloregulator ArsR/SmtB family transcription factor [Oscillospiraceae bacterium]|jgi:ArsR family transcriptional regulator|nr:metalloregulator ArsR/SmtB family transcription factor [Oscillospiraceae bacterium]MDD3261310.1 metalloregulator ArsR/SmtB family transcription factor [Oscillospiraceae bacterium]
MPDKNGIERCDFFHVHEDIIKKVEQQMPDEDALYDLAELFKVFGDSTRIKILYVLFESEVCVCDIAQLLKMNQSAISHQLRVLKQSQLVKCRRDGKTVFYSLADDHVRTILGTGMDHLLELNGGQSF